MIRVRFPAGTQTYIFNPVLRMRLLQRCRGIMQALRKTELGLLVNLLTIVVSAWCFVRVASEMQQGKTQAFDVWALRALRQSGNLSQPIGPTWLPQVARDITSFGGGSVLIILSAITVGFLCLRRKFHAVALLVITLISGTLLDVSLKAWFGRARPTVVPRLTSFSSDSFPSGHSMLSAITYLTIGVILARLTEGRDSKIYFLTVGAGLAFAVGLSRVYLGVHYPTDVLAGWTAGIAWAILCDLVAQRLQRARLVEPPDPGPAGNA